MAYQSAGFMMIRKSDLPKTPQAFQSYVRGYFKKVNYLGETFLAAIIAPGDISRPDQEPPAKGVAPSCTDLDDLINSQKRKGKRSTIFVLDADWDDGHTECLADGD